MPALRTWLTGLAVIALWFLSVYAQTPPAVRGADALATQFSAARAGAVLARLEGPGRPHPAGSAENAAVHTRLLQELSRLGVKAHSLSRMSCYSEPRWGTIECARITDIVATIVPGEGKAVVMMAHMDSVPAGPGAGDDGAGVAAILETIRALQARGLTQSKHPILALFTDGEEFGMLGAAAFLRDPLWRAQVGIVLNMEGRGSSGQSLLFQTSPGNSRLIDLYAARVPRYASSSLNAEVYRFLPNDTDLTPFLGAGLTGYNFAFVGTIADYHTPHDTLARLDLRSLQSHGDNLLALVAALEQTDFAALKSGDDAYLDVFGLWLPRLPAGWMLPLALAAFMLIAWAGWRIRDRDTFWPQVRAGLMPPALLLGSVAAGFALHYIAAAISGNSDPSFAHPLALRLALALGVWAMALLATRLGAGAIGCWLWLTGFGIVTAAWLPGISPYFVFPSSIAAVTFAIAAWRGREIAVPALILPALAAVIVWLGLVVRGEELLGLAGHPLFTVPAAFALIALTPLLQRLDRRAFIISVAASGALALFAALVAGLEPAYSAARPQRLNLGYVEQDGRALWTADAVPPSLRAVANFSARPQPMVLTSVYVAPAGKAQFPPPTAAVSRKGADVTLHLHGSNAASAMLLAIPKRAGLVSVTIGGQIFAVHPSGRFVIACATAECRDSQIVLRLGAPVTLTLAEQRFGLPPEGIRLTKARGHTAVPSQFGDTMLLIKKIAIAGQGP